jgi:hypothetical protein
MNLTSVRKNVLQDILVRLTFDGSFQRANIYKKNVSDEMREEFRKSLASILPVTLDKILARKKYTTNDHCNTIKKFSKTITGKHFKILQGNKLRIGNAQKFINIYWKVCWLLKKNVRKPIHCPFDSIIIQKLDKSVRKIAWTQLNLMNDYKRLVQAAQRKAGKGNSLADWELKIYQESINYE